MSRTGGGNRRSANDLLWGWGTNGDRHPGLIERIENIEKRLDRATKVGATVILAEVINLIGSGSGAHFVQSLQQAWSVVSTLLP